MQKHVHIIGAGLSGLVAATELLKKEASMAIMRQKEHFQEAVFSVASAQQKASIKTLRNNIIMI